MRLDVLSAKYEGGGPATISTGAGDCGGVSMGTYQLSTSAGSVANFVLWLQQRSDFGRDYGNLLAKNPPGSMEFSADWLSLAETDVVGFGNLQTEFVTPRYYDAAVDEVWRRGVPTELPDALKCVIFSNAIQHGPYNAGELVADSYDADPAVWITKIYDTKINDPDWSSGAPSLRPGLFARWENEKQDALTLLAGGTI